MELSNLLPDGIVWQAFAAMQWLLMASLCWWLPTKWVRWSLMALFVSSAADEALSGNLFGEGYWEYPAWALMTTCIYLITKAWR